MSAPLPEMRPFGDPVDGPLMQCLHCGQVMGMDLLLQIAHSNFCPPPDERGPLDKG